MSKRTPGDRRKGSRSHTETTHSLLPLRWVVPEPGPFLLGSTELAGLRGPRAVCCCTKTYSKTPQLQQLSAALHQDSATSTISCCQRMPAACPFVRLYPKHRLPRDTNPMGRPGWPNTYRANQDCCSRAGAEVRLIRGSERDRCWLASLRPALHTHSRKDRAMPLLQKDPHPLYKHKPLQCTR